MSIFNMVHEVVKKEDIELITNACLEMYNKEGLSEYDKKELEARILEVNIKLAPQVLKKYGKNSDDDALQVAFIGLIKAVRNFDINQGTPFSNYACFMMERELRWVHKNVDLKVFDNMVTMDYLDEPIPGVEDKVSKYDQIADASAEEAFIQLIEDNSLNDLVEKVIKPTLEMFGKKSEGHKGSNLDVQAWKQLELNYILGLADLQLGPKLTISGAAKFLGLSQKRFRDKHVSVLEEIRVRAAKLYNREEI